jgi:hypothetical protein
MATKHVSNATFWTVLIGGGLLVLLLGSFAVYMNMNTVKSVRMVSVGSAGGAVGMMAPGAPTMDMYYGTKAVAESSMPYPSPVPPYYGGGGDTAATATPRIIKTASLALEVKSSRESAKMVADVAKLNNGFVESSNVVENQDGTVNAYVTIRVPEDKFDATISSLTGLALSVRTETINGQDVTEQYTDLQARLKNAQAQEAQYLDILKKANTVQDILAVQQYLSQVRYEIESYQGQLKNLTNQTSYSTISVALMEQANLNVPAGKFDIVRDIKQAGQAVILLGQTFLTFAVWFIIIGGAMAIPTAIIIYLIYRLVRKLVTR